MAAKPPVTLFISKESIATFWFLVGAIAAVGSLIYVERVAANSGLRPQFILMQSAEVHRVPKDMKRNPVKLQAAHEAVARLILDSAFNKSSNGLDAADRCQRLMSRNAWEWVKLNLVANQEDAFKEAHIHQKIALESLRVELDAEDGETSRVLAIGQLIRTGIRGENLFNEVWSVTVTMSLERNTCLRDAGRYPVICTTFACKELPVASTQTHATLEEGASFRAAEDKAKASEDAAAPEQGTKP